MTFELPPPITPVSLMMQDGGAYLLERSLSDLHRQDGRVYVDGFGELILMSSYSYLGLVGHPRIEAAAKAAIDEDSTGVHGVRLLAGTLPVHRALEARLSAMSGCEDAILYSSGYVANLATIAGLVGPGDAVFTDVLNHASINDGCKLSGAEIVPFAHNNPKDLRRRIKRTTSVKNKLIVADAVYSMDGDIADLPAMLEIAEEAGALLMIDEAHSFGVLGKRGHGIFEHFGLGPSASVLKMGTLSKTIPSIGGYVAASAEIVRMLRHRARGYIFSSALPAPCAAAALAALDVVDDEPERVVALHRNAELFRVLLTEAGVNTLRSETAVIPAICGESARAIAVSRRCVQNGVFALPVTTPAVQDHLARLRLIPLATHSEKDLRLAAKIVINAMRSEGVLASKAPSRRSRCETAPECAP